MQSSLYALIFLALIASPAKAEVGVNIEAIDDASETSDASDTLNSPRDSSIISRCIHIPLDSVHPDDIAFTGCAKIEGAVQGDVVISEGPFTLSGETDGDVVLISGNFSISGEVKGDLVAIGGTGQVSGTLNGDVVIIGGSLRLDSTAVIEGDITVVSAELEKHPAAVVKGEEIIVSLGPLGKILVKVLSHRIPAGTIEIDKPSAGHRIAAGMRLFSSLTRLVLIAVFYLLGLLMLVAIPRWQRRSQLAVQRVIWKTVLTGVVYRLAVGGIFAILIVSIIGWLLVPVAALGWMFIALMAVPQAALWVGRLIKKWLHFSTESRIGLYSLGFAAVYLFSIVSGVLSLFGQTTSLSARITYIIGFLVVFAAMTIGRGAVIYTLIFSKEARTLESQANQETDEKG